MGATGDRPDDATRSLIQGPAKSTGGHTAATAVLSEPGPVSPSPDRDRGDPGDGEAEAAPAPDQLAVGTRVGRFSVLGTLGVGGMGVVYAAYDPELDRRVAIKLLGGTRDRSREANLRLLREAQAMARLSHPNVVAVYDVGEHAGIVFVAMELVDGATLRAWCEDRPRRWREIRDVLLQAGRGLAAAHRTGLVHRDFKPGNVLIDADGRAKVTDFGIARLDDSDDPDAAGGARPASALASGVTPLAIDLTRTGTAIGTPAYMAPEQHRGLAVDARADQFAFCVTAWEAVYGERPFAGTGAELIRAIAEGAIRPPRDTKEIPPWVAPLLRRGLADKPEARWPSLDQLLDRLADDPAVRRRQRIAFASAVVVVGGLAAGATYLAAQHDTATCGAGDRELAETWNPALRSTADAAFRATGSPLAADHWRRVTGAIDAWSTQWVGARRDACELHDRKVQSDDLYDRRIACLGRARGRLAALVDLMQTADAVVVRESVMAAALLPPPTDCGDVDALLGARPLPADPAVRAEVATFGNQIERVNTLRTIGRYKEALQLVTDMYQRSTAIDYLPLQAELSFGVGMLQSDVSDAGAEASLRHATDVAATARYPELYARAWSALVFEIGVKRQRFDDATPLRTLAWQAVHLAGDTPDLTAALQMHEGAVDLVHGDKAKAIESLEKSVAITAKQHGADSISLVASLNLLAISVAGDHPDQAIVHYQHALDILGRRVSPNHPRAGSILGNLGNIATDQGRFAEAVDYHRRALAIIEAGQGKDSQELGAPLNGLGLALWAVGKWDEAYALIERARVIWEGKLGHDHPYIAIALTNLGGLRQEQGRWAEGVKLLEEARAIQDKVLPPDHTARGMNLQFLAGCLIELGRPAEAIPLLERARAIYAAKGTPLEQAGPKFELARAMWALGKDRPTAIAMAEDARKVFAADKADQAQTAAGVKSSSAEIAEWLGDKTPKR